ncbi:RsmE family RNA methyltransferase [Rubripirellula reticaptiva]|uniref:Ribosomal RNA small subunit methyltransferase E n=1 Tax=Rubripirellula reticaptiva TaxID=2528013 RepID=A0A5C6EE34_9BACT|nr:RsmE family RNA methyltransferase [Rubripirellula reticaptiva]TWU46745.1 Ribosomal RNA small subunit methyltransferase E [Rubripirellula reticaptiva]
MTRRYFVPDLPRNGGLVPLPSEEAQHAIRVMRIRVDDPMTLFDGCGYEAEATVISLGRNKCQCQAEVASAINREPACKVHMAIALPKPDRAKELVERLTELGVASLTPILGKRSQRPPKDTFLEKLRRASVEACKQSGRNQLMEIHDTVSAIDYFESTIEGPRLIAHPTQSTASLDSFRNAPVLTTAIGPEGGWTDEEIEIATRHGFLGVDLGSRIYRIETAAVVVAAVLVT